MAWEVHREELNDALNITNFVRYLAYLPDDITLNESFNVEAQAASVVNASNQQITHHPERPKDMEEVFYELGELGASSSNLGLGYTDIKSSIQNGYMRGEDDSNRDRVGRRRWVFIAKIARSRFWIRCRDR